MRDVAVRVEVVSPERVLDLLLARALAQHGQTAHQFTEIDPSVAVLIKKGKQTLRDEIARDTERAETVFEGLFVDAAATVGERLELFEQVFDLHLID